MNDDVLILEPGKGSRVLELGAPREEVLRRLADAGLEIDHDEDDDEGDDRRWTYVDEIDTELTFSAEPRGELQEIAISDDRVRLGPIDMIDEPVGKIVEMLKVSDEETLWTLHADDLTTPDASVATALDAAGASGSASDGASPPTDETLLKGATLWIKPFGLGLDVVYGEVITVRLRRPGDVPREGIGPLTPAQRALANREDLTSILFRSTRTDGVGSGKMSRFQTMLGLGLIASLGVVVWRGIDTQRRWNEAPAVQGTVVAVEPPPPEPFPERYTIAYSDDAGVQHRVVFERMDVYVTPKVGETVEIKYLPEAPDEPLGPARVRDIAFERFVPWGIGVVAGYFVLQAAMAIGSLAWRRVGTTSQRMRATAE